MIKVTLKDGSVKEYAKGTTVMDIAKSISEGLARSIVAASVNGEVVGLNYEVNEDCELSLFKFEDEEGNYTKIYQWFLTSYSLDDVRFLEDHFGLLFTYSEKLDLYVLCVDHYGTSWDYVHCCTDLENAVRELGE